MTCTELLAELKTIEKRIQTKRQFINEFAMRSGAFKDPLEKQGGSVEVLKQEKQAMSDLQARVMKIRAAIQKSNLENTITISGYTKSISEWLTWRKEVAPNHLSFLNSLFTNIQNVRKQALQRGAQIVKGTEQEGLNDLIVNLDETVLQKERDDVQKILGELDGQLSLKNATINIEV